MVELLGRTVECEAVDGLIEATRDGTGGSLVLCGDPGIGKSALLDYAARSATGLRVERVAGAEAETVLGYGGVHQLVGSMLEDVEALPEPQRRALQLGFGLAVNGEPEPFLLDLGVLGLLERAAADQALLCLVDDVHWLDGASGGTFAFVARRLHQVGLAFVFATEPPESSTPLEGLPLLRVAALDDNHARTMLGRAVAGSLDPVVRARLVLEAAGNPLALQQLVAGLTPAQLDGGESLPDRLSTGEGVEHSVVRRIRRLPLDTQQLLLLLAAEPSGDEALLARAAAELGVGPEAVGPAEAAELLQVGRLALRQVFVGSALYAAAPVEARRRVHAALADACDPELDSDRRAWHRAATIVWPDGELAEELERSAPRALARGGHPAAA